MPPRPPRKELTKVLGWLAASHPMLQEDGLYRLSTVLREAAQEERFPKAEEIWTEIINNRVPQRSSYNIYNIVEHLVRLAERSHMYCPKCDGEGVGVWDGEYITCKYCGGTGIYQEYQDDEEEEMLWESYYEPDDKRRILLDEDEWCDYSGWIGGPSFSDPF